jgi:hypothetical protein
VITDPRIGELVPVDSAEAMAEGLKRAAVRATDSEHDAFRRAAASRYGREEVAAKHFEILQQIAAAQSARTVRLSGLVAASERVA